MLFAFTAVLVLLGLASALMIITNREPMESALFLIVTLFTVAILYVILHAEFLAAVQIIVYAGAIMVLITFVIQLTGASSLKGLLNQKQTPLVLGVVGLFFFHLIALSVFSFGALRTPDDATMEKETVASFAKVLFTEYAWPFEIASVLLLVAIFGTVLLAQRKGIRS